MGLIKYKGEVIYTGPVGHVTVNSNWNDSMADYYPTVGVTYLNDAGEISFKYINVVNGFSYPVTELCVIADNDIELEIARIRKDQADKEEAERISMHKLVRVVRGRKVPNGTEGEIFWMGNNGYGMSVGLRLIDGSKVFTAMSNVQVVSLDEIIERDILGT